jgi:uncharacterized protein YjaG (DUF416 family)
MSNTQQLRDLEEWQQIAYGAALVERMYPNFALFSEVRGADDAKVYRNILNLVWEFISGKNNKIDFQKQLEKLELVTPDPQQFDMYGVWPALDASVGLSSLLSVYARWEATEISAIETLTVSTIDSYLQAIDDQEDESLYQADLQFRQEVIDMLIAGKNDNRNELMLQLKHLIAEWEVSNIGLSTT